MIQRYILNSNENGWTMCPNPSGEWCKAEEVRELEVENKKLRNCDNCLHREDEYPDDDECQVCNDKSQWKPPEE